jgi:hypothetical protein
MNRILKSTIAIGMLVTLLASAALVTSSTSVAQGQGKAFDVNVLNEVEVKNASGTALPVTVNNLPAVQSPPEPVTFSFTLGFGEGDSFSSDIFYTVPADKRLVIEHWSAYITVFGGAEYRLDISVSSGGSPHLFAYGFRENWEAYALGQENVQIHADAGSEVRVSGRSSVANPTPASIYFMNGSVTGHLYDAPAASP